MIDAPPAVVEKVLEDVASYPSFMPYVTEARMISQDGNDVVTYQRLNVPVVSNRDYTVRVEHGTAKGTSGGTIFRDTWQTANEERAPGKARVGAGKGE